MYEKVVKDSNKKPASHKSTQEQNRGSSKVTIVNNRPQAVSQRKLQDLADNSPQVQDMLSFEEINPVETSVIQQAPDKGVIQRTTIKEILQDGRIGIQALGNIINWLEDRTGQEIAGADMDENNWNRFLKDLSLEEVVNYAEARAGRIEKEDESDLSLEDLIGVDLQSTGIAWGTVVNHVNHSSIGKYTRVKLVPDHDPIVVLKDAEFNAAHLSEYMKLNQLDHIDEATLFSHNQDIDTVNGFHSRLSGNIYIRKEAAMDGNYHFPIHEAIHKCSHAQFSRLLGHAFNEAATEMIARKVCGEIGVPLKGQPYEAEIRLFGELSSELGFDSIEVLEFAYFTGKVEAMGQSLQKILGSEESYRHFIAANNAKQARFTLEVSQIQPISLDEALGEDLPPITFGKQESNESNEETQPE